LFLGWVPLQPPLFRHHHLHRVHLLPLLLLRRRVQCECGCEAI
jgi:hypothetical protein